MTDSSALASVQSARQRQALAHPDCVGCQRALTDSMFPSHKASPFCESGGKPHCTCDRCF